ncbi:DeoR/GlpR family DNA-binding transcription regulator [Staphylococcus auricularis]|uniref:DeoR/GlpR family DNA-binding transcription regulator n=1 Tax=Staphylococcus auricularis TaxID=29379 RepID=UPI0019324A84|nr:DeoR/GlpR family DNA-binding transcription regulator [Staphylococcus auricularis]
MNIKEARHQIILDKLKSAGTVSVNALSEEMDVAQMTIRRDLKELENHKQLIRVHGGAVLPKQYYNELANDEKKALQSASKSEIAQKASALIQDGDTVFIGSGTTNESLYPYLNDKSLHIITNSLHIFQQYTHHDHIDVVLVGGRYRTKTGTFVGVLANAVLERLNIDKCFIGANGIYNQYVSTANEEEAQANKIILDQSKEKYITADQSKFNIRAFIEFYDIAQLTGIITDDALDSSVYESYSDYTKIY